MSKDKTDPLKALKAQLSSLEKEVSAFLKEVPEPGVSLEVHEKTEESNQEMFKAITEQLNDLNTRMDNIQSSSESRQFVTSIDPNLTYQRCLEIALTSLQATTSASDLMRSEEARDDLCKRVVVLADSLHSAVCRHYQIDNA